MVLVVWGQHYGRSAVFMPVLCGFPEHLVSQSVTQNTEQDGLSPDAISDLKVPYSRSYSPSPLPLCHRAFDPS